MRRRSAGNDVPGGNEKHVRPIELKPLIGRLNDVCRRALEAAAGVTALRTHYNVEIEHLLIGLLDRTDTDLAAILRKWDVEPARLLADLNRSLDRMKTGNARAPALSPDIVEMVKQAWLLASVEQGASRVRSGHLLWALLADDMLARRAREVVGSFARDRARHAQERLSRDLRQHRRGGTGHQPGGRLRSGRHRRRAKCRPGGSGGPRPVHDRPHGAGQGRQDRSDPRPRLRDPPDGRHPDASSPEQSDPHRRSGRRQDRRRRRPGAAHRRRRRAAGAARRDLAHARSRPAAGRRRREGRIREPPEIGDRGDQGQPQADHPVHRRSAYADRRRRRGGPERCGQSAEAGAGARRTADDRRDHLGRIQEVFREGRGPHPSLPAGEGRGAERKDGHRHDPRPRLHPRAASQGAHPRRSGERSRAPVGALHSGPPVAGQGGQPDRYRLRPRGDEPERHPGADRRLASAASA